MSNLIKKKCISAMRKFWYCLKIAIHGVKLKVANQICQFWIIGFGTLG